MTAGVPDAEGGFPQSQTLTVPDPVSLGQREVLTGVRRAVAFAGSVIGRSKRIFLYRLSCSMYGSRRAKKLHPGPRSGASALQFPAGKDHAAFDSLEMNPGGNEPWSPW